MASGSVIRTEGTLSILLLIALMRAVNMDPLKPRASVFNLSRAVIACTGV